MRPFKYTRASDPDGAARALAANPQAKFLAGGTNILDLMKEYVERPTELIDLTRLKLAEIKSAPNGGVSIGALAKNTDTAYHAVVTAFCFAEPVPYRSSVAAIDAARAAA